jgi:hypothetical protein
MSSAFAIAAVTTVLKDLLNNGLIDQDVSAALGNVMVTALPPDRIAVGSEERSQLNVVLYQAMPNSGWRNVGLPSRDQRGDAISNPPLALDLHYLISAYGAEDTHAEALLGYAMLLLHETPALTRQAINQSLKPNLPPGVTLPPGLALLATSDLAEQFEYIKISPQYLNVEELSKLWTAFQARFRPSAGYLVTVVLIEGNKPARSPLPVLKRGEADGGPLAQADLIPPFPAIESLDLPNNQPSARLDDGVTLRGHHFAGDDGDKTQVTVAVQLTTPRLPAPIEVVVPATDRSDSHISFNVLNDPAAVPAGIYTLGVSVMPNGKPLEKRTTNEAPLLIAPVIIQVNGGALPATVARDGNGDTQLTMQCVPDVRSEQRVALVVGSREVSANPRIQATDPLVFVLKQAAAGEFRLRLRVDGVESWLVDRSDIKHPKFDETQKVTIT